MDSLAGPPAAGGASRNRTSTAEILPSLTTRTSPSAHGSFPRRNSVTSTPSTPSAALWMTWETSPRGDRLSLLASWEEELLSSYDSRPDHPITVALGETIRRFHIPREPFLKLIEANRIDQRAHRHRTHGDLLHYCDHSANPVGRLFLYLFGYRDEERQRLADATCTALQLTNFWQDVRRDLEMGRVYIPQEDMERFGYPEERLQAGVADEAFRDLMRFQVDRARALFDQGARLVDMVDGAARLDIALFTMGGLHILKAIERRGYDVLRSRPTLSKAAKARLLVSTAARLKLKRRI